MALKYCSASYVNINFIWELFFIMKYIFYFLFGIAILVLCSAVKGATLTTHAKHILWNEIDSIDTKYHAEIQCLAENIYFEARTESMTGKAAVGNVTKNRVLDKRWPSTYCEVVKYGPVRESWKTKGKDVKDEDRVYWPIKHRCQFSWYCDGKDDIIWANYELTPNKEIIEGNANAWTDAVKLAIMITGYGRLVVEDNTSGALYYYNHNLVYPAWAPEKEFIGIEGNHTFMK